jgi:hypothetical protein
MFVGGTGSSAAIWLNSLGKTSEPSAAEKLFGATTGKDDPAKPAASNTSFPTAPPVNLGVEALLALQDAAAPASAQTPTGSSESVEEDNGPSAADQFLDYMKKSPEERLRDKILKALGVTEDDIKSMSPDERVALEEKIKDIVKETMVKAEGPGAPEREEAGFKAKLQQFMLEQA